MVGEPRWTTLLGQWMQASACVRCIHATRSDVLSITGSTVRACHLPRGMQKRSRRGFWLWTAS